MLAVLLAMLFAVQTPPVSAAIFDFTPLNGNVSAVYVGGSSGNVQLSISGANAISVPSGNTQNLTTNNGIVAWSDSTRRDTGTPAAGALRAKVTCEGAVSVGSMLHATDPATS